MSGFIVLNKTTLAHNFSVRVFAYAHILKHEERAEHCSEDVKLIKLDAPHCSYWAGRIGKVFATS